MFWIELWAMLQVIGMVIPIAIFGIIFLVLIVQILKTSMKQALCKHENFNENMACHAICRSCGKDLGFIGTVREQRKKKDTL